MPIRTLTDAAARARDEERGEALILVLLVAFAILALGIVGSRAARIEIQIARHDVLAKQALALAEGGLNHAFTLLAAAGSFDDELDGDADTVHDGTGGVLASSPGLGSAATYDWNDDGTATESARFRALATGGYYVRIEDNWDEETGTDDQARDKDQSVKIVSVGIAGNAERRVEGLVSLDNSPDCAITVQGDIMVSGDAQITGTSGCLHSNEDVINISGGNPNFETGATASATMDISGTPTMEDPWGQLSTQTEKDDYASAHEGQPSKTIPKICPLEFGPTSLNLANIARARGGYLLAEDGRVYNSSADWGCAPGNPGSNPCTINSGHIASGSWEGWKWGSDGAEPGAKWEYEWTGTSAVNGIYFVEGHVIIPADAGTSAVPWDTTIIAMNSISVSGNPSMRPFETTGDLRNVLFVSGNDLGLGGNLGIGGRPAASFAHQQLKFNGNPGYTGYFMAEDGATTCSPNIAPTAATKESYEDGYSILSGNPTITFDGNVDTALFQGSVRLVSWNEVRKP